MTRRITTRGDAGGTVAMPRPLCCRAMGRRLRDGTVQYDAQFRETAIPDPPGGHAQYGIRCCPWCGVRLPQSLRSEWFRRLEALGVPDPWGDRRRIPHLFRSDDWWRDDASLAQPE